MKSDLACAESNAGRIRVFLAEDDREMRRMIALALRRDGHFVVEAKDGASLLADLGHVFIGEPPALSPSLVITDVRMPGSDGLSILRRMREHPWCPPFILITAFGDLQLHEDARGLGAEAVFDKPFDVALLVAEVRRIANSLSDPARAGSPAAGSTPEAPR